MGSGEHKPTVGEQRKAAIPQFSPETFLRYLVRFIVADDQVSPHFLYIHTPFIFCKAIRVVECPEFRDLCMLLRPALDDRQIPRRDKVRESVINQFGQEFGKLKIELAVRFHHLTEISADTIYFYRTL